MTKEDFIASLLINLLFIGYGLIREFRESKNEPTKWSWKNYYENSEF